jgi:Pyruvate/2-oxoacid:ferredoxin oxidoreductase delta subunit
MMKTLTTILLALSISAPTLAQQTGTAASADLARIAEQIRQKRIDVGGDYSMNHKTGRFHIVHADKMLMDCSNCHFGEHYQPDYLSASRDKPYPDEAKGQYVRSVCLGCHQAGGLATRWYNTSTKK